LSVKKITQPTGIRIVKNRIWKSTE